MIPTVYLVGAGPGDFELMTLKGKRCIQQADVLIYDRLASDAFLQLAKPGCRLIYAGKQAGNHAIPQEELNQLIAREALAGHRVVRLKGGDPYVFGRGGEEALCLRQYGVPFEVVPGVTSAIAGLCYAGIPITQRDYAASFHVITGHAKEGVEREPDWQLLARQEGTLVFLMGLGHLDQIAGGLLAAGKDPATPAAVISNASLYNQQVRTAPLGEIAREVAQNPVPSPAIIVVGQVVSLREQLSFFERRPLFGKTVGVTRGRGQNQQLLEQLESLGARGVSMPMISIVPQPAPELEGKLKHLGDYSWLVLTSQNAAQIFFERLFASGRDSRALGGVKICAIGAATAGELEKRGLTPDCVPPAFSSQGIWQVLGPMLTSQDRVLLPRGKKTVSRLAQRMGEICPVDEVILYETQPEKQANREGLALLAEGKLDYLAVSSPSILTSLWNQLENPGAVLSSTRLVTIGPVTTQAVLDAGLPQPLEAHVSTQEGMVQAILEDCQRRSQQ